jgi:hypothetical protein
MGLIAPDPELVREVVAVLLPALLAIVDAVANALHALYR